MTAPQATPAPGVLAAVLAPDLVAIISYLTATAGELDRPVPYVLTAQADALLEAEDAGWGGRGPSASYEEWLAEGLAEPGEHTGGGSGA